MPPGEAGVAVFSLDFLGRPTAFVPRFARCTADFREMSLRFDCLPRVFAGLALERTRGFRRLGDVDRTRNFRFGCLAKACCVFPVSRRLALDFTALSATVFTDQACGKAKTWKVRGAVLSGQEFVSAERPPHRCSDEGASFALPRSGAGAAPPLA